jgi:hypothetical protein
MYTRYLSIYNGNLSFMNNTVKDTNIAINLKKSVRRCSLDLGPNAKTIPGPREERSWTTL